MNLMSNTTAHPPVKPKKKNICDTRRQHSDPKIAVKARQDTVTEAEREAFTSGSTRILISQIGGTASLATRLRCDFE
jgi:hypothetical protein